MAVDTESRDRDETSIKIGEGFIHQRILGCKGKGGEVDVWRAPFDRLVRRCDKSIGIPQESRELRGLHLRIDMSSPTELNQLG